MPSNNSIPNSFWAYGGAGAYTSSLDEYQTNIVQQILKKKKPIVKKTNYHKDEKNYNWLVQDYWQNYSQPIEKEIGLEIECEGENLFSTPIEYWSVHTDNSLRTYKGHTPLEYVLREPLSRSKLSDALQYLTNKLKLAKSNIVQSERCSVHVHLNCQHYTIKQVITIVALYLILEDILVEWCGKERVGNLFCLRAKDTVFFIRSLETYIHQDQYTQFSSDQLRYTSCNIASLPKYGSLEFRAMRGTVDSKLIQLWVDILLQLKKKALELNRPTDIITLWDRYKPRDFLTVVLDQYSDIFRNIPDLSERLWDGIRIVKEFLYAATWDDALPKVEAKEEKKSRSKVKPPVEDLPLPMPEEPPSGMWAPVEEEPFVEDEDDF